MARATQRLLIVGIGGSGRTHHLRAWADAQQRLVDGNVIWLRGAVDHRDRANAARRLLESLDRVADDDALAVDDAHWLGESVVERIIEIAEQVPVAVTRAPWPDSAALRELDAVLTTEHSALRLDELDDDSLAALLDQLGVDSQDRAALLASTAGSAGLVRLLTDAGIQPGDTGEPALPPQVIDAIVRRAQASGSDVLEATRIMVHGVGASVAAQLVEVERPEHHGDLERRLRVSGLVSNDRLVRIVSTAIAADMTEADRRRSITQASGAGDALQPNDRSRLVLASDGDPLGRARAAVHLGDPSADSLVAALSDVRDPSAARLAFTLDMRAMRWQRAAGRNIETTIGGDLRTLAEVLGGSTGPIDPADNVAATTPEQVLDDTHRLIARFATGSTDAVAAQATRLMDDAQRARVNIEAGWSPASIAASVLMQSGRHESARTALRATIADDLEGPGEQAAHHVLAAFGDIATGEYSAALDLVRAGPTEGWPHRDHFLLAALDAAIARRSGDTSRLRDAWRRSKPLMERQSATWLLVDPMIEILAAGRRVGDDVVVDTALDRLTAQLAAWPVDGPGPVLVAWTRLQVAIAGEDWQGVQHAARSLSTTSSLDDRSTARRGAAGVWSAIASRLHGRPDDDATQPGDELDAVISALVSVGDAWEASRLLGQLALDHPDAATARSLLEQARLLVSDPVDAADGLIAAGLSEREADVARLVAQGRSYKEIGAQLFISAKTVEHHVARIKQRLGARSRAEFLSLVRELSGDP